MASSDVQPPVDDPAGKARIHCDLCDHPQMEVAVDSSTLCVCGRPPSRYSTKETTYCFVHKVPMTGSYLTTADFIFVHYGWLGGKHLFPNAILFPVSDEMLRKNPDVITFDYCDQCESAHRQWLADTNISSEE